MFEKYTYNYLMTRCLARVPNTVDKREGSIIYDAIAISCIEMAQMYVECDNILNETFADTASRTWLIKRAAEQGIEPVPATYAILKGVFNVSVNIGERFTLGDLTYIVTELIDNTTHSYKVKCETAGTAGNEKLGTLIPIQSISGLVSAELTEVLIPGEEEEDTETFRARYFSKVNIEAFGGNKQDYINRVGQIQGVGGLKVIPAWAGGGTVKCVIIDNNYNTPSQSVVDYVKQQVDPTKYTGQGETGVVPIGHQVTIEGVASVIANIRFTITFEDGYAWNNMSSAITALLEAYLLSLRKTWAKSKFLVVKLYKIEQIVSETPGIIMVENIKINGIASNLILSAYQIPKLGSVTNG